MKYRTVVAFVFLAAFSSVCQAQDPSANCSYGYWTLTQSPYNQGPCTVPPSQITETDTYYEECRALSGNTSGIPPGSDYWTSVPSSSVTGTGQNYCAGFPYYYQATCPPYMHFYETDGGYA